MSYCYIFWSTTNPVEHRDYFENLKYLLETGNYDKLLEHMLKDFPGNIGKQDSKNIYVLGWVLYQARLVPTWFLLKPSQVPKSTTGVYSYILTTEEDKKALEDMLDIMKNTDISDKQGDVFEEYLTRAAFFAVHEKTKIGFNLEFKATRRWDLKLICLTNQLMLLSEMDHDLYNIEWHDVS